MRARWEAVLTTAVTLALSALAPPASATDPVDLGDGRVVDQVSALSSSELAAAEDELQALYDETGADLYVVFVDDFTNPSDRIQWADTVALDNGLGAPQYLLAVATEGRQYYVSNDSEGPLAPEELDALDAAIRPQLSEQDWAGAITAAADSMTDAIGGADNSADTSSSGGFLTTGLVVLAVVAGIILIVVLVRRRKKPAVPGGAPGIPGTPVEPPVPLEELSRRASSALIEADDAIKTSAQELQFAEAQFGKEATREFEQALAAARTNLDEAFTLKQRLDDATPESEEDARAWNERIVALCEQSDAALDEKSADFDELRKLEQNAPEALARVQEERTRAAATLDDSDGRLRTLSASYAPEALSTVADNPDQARARLEFADEQLAAAEAAIGAGKGGEAAVGIRAAEEAVAQAVLLQQAIGRLQTDLAAAETGAAALIAELEQDAAAASALPDPDGTVAGAIAATRQQIDAARANLASTAKRPLLTLQSLEAANTRIDALVKGIRDAAAQTQRARQMVGQLILQAQAQVSAAEDYITARRGAVGAEARTRLAEAGAALVRAQQYQEADPQQAMQHAQRADQLAGQAIQLAQNDVGAFGGGMGGMGGGMGGMLGGGQGQGGGGMLGAVLGGILINSMMSGGRSSGGLGGGLGGMLGGGASRGGGGFRPGSFGGGGTRGRRGGGRF